MTMTTKAAGPRVDVTSKQNPQGGGALEGWRQRGLNGEEAKLVRATDRAVQVRVDLKLQSQMRGDKFHPQKCGTGGFPGGPRSCHPSQPTPRESCHPRGSLKTDPNGRVTTPGGYTIESKKQHEWTITGPDGKSTRVWGDPHVAEGDGGTWDFKRDSTFVLGDGTRVNVSTKPFGNGMTVTSGLDIVSGNDRVRISDIDQGPGKTGPVTEDGFQHVNDFGGKDVFVMGRETDDWSFQGREVIGSNNGGESFNLGGALPPGSPRTSPFGGGPRGPGGILPGEPPPGKPGRECDSFLEQMQQLFSQLSKLFEGLSGMGGDWSRQCGNEPVCAPGQGGSWKSRRQEHLSKCFDDIGRMRDLSAHRDSMTRGIGAMRRGFQA